MEKTGSKIPAGFWATPEGCTLNVVMHISAWDGLDCLNDQIEALAKAAEATADAAIKIATARPGFAGTDTFLEMIGFDQADVRRIKAQEQLVRGRQTLQELNI